jgi:hypothetical protein
MSCVPAPRPARSRSQTDVPGPAAALAIVNSSAISAPSLLLGQTEKDTMSTRPEPRAARLDDPQIPVQTKLAAAWTSFMFLYIYVDYLHLYKPGVIDDILAGIVWEFDIGQAFVVSALTLMAIPILMILLSTTLPARANRATNLVVASLYIPVSAFNAVGESWTLFYGLGVALEVLLLAGIIRCNYRRPRTARTAVQAAPVEVQGLGLAQAGLAQG